MLSLHATCPLLQVQQTHAARHWFSSLFSHIVMRLLVIIGLAPSDSLLFAHAPYEAADTRETQLLEAFVRRRCGTLWHAQGGLGMGEVTDHHLIIQGTTNVHVSGVAAFPRPLSCNPMATCYAIGWRLGEIAAADYK